MTPESAASMPSLHALRCFDIAARAESFSAAARIMHLTHGAISRQVRTLEIDLKTLLFVRSGRRLALTAEGRELQRVTAQAFATLEDGVGKLRRSRGGPVVLSCEPTLAVNWLVPHLVDFYAQHPSAVVHVESSGGAIDLSRAGVDIAIRRRDFFVDPSLRCEPLMDEWLALVCSPSVVARVRKGSPVPRLATRTRPKAFDDWARAAGRPVPAKSARDLQFDRFALSLQACAMGLGVAVGPYPLVADAIEAGQLVAPFGWVRGETGYVLLTRSDRTPDARIAELERWLHKEATAATPRARRAAQRS